MTERISLEGKVAVVTGAGRGLGRAYIELWVVRMYSKGLVNFRTGVITPAIGVALTEVSVRASFRTNSDATDIDKDQRLQDEHMRSAAISAIAALLIYALMTEAALPMVVALSAAAIWSGAAAGAYYVKTHRAEIRSAIESAHDKLRDGTRVATKAVRDASARMRPPGVVTDKPTSLDSARASTPKDRATMALVAMVAVAVLAGSLLAAPVLHGPVHLQREG
jgi:NAD(P)-dependent dehydrogenase (short-subunit alcohol dehydrogenase family)